MASAFNKAKHLFARDKGGSEDSGFEDNRTKFKNLRKNLKAIQESVRKHAKYVQGLSRPMEEVSLAVNLLYTDAARPESQYVEQGKQLSKSTGEIGKAVEEFDREAISLQTMIEVYLNQLEAIRKDIDERDKLYESYASKKKDYQSATEKEKDSGKLEKIKDKFQAAKDAYEDSNDKTLSKLTEVTERACEDFEPTYRKLMFMHVKLFRALDATFDNVDNVDVSDYTAPSGKKSKDADKKKNRMTTNYGESDMTISYPDTRDKPPQPNRLSVHNGVLVADGSTDDTPGSPRNSNVPPSLPGRGPSASVSGGAPPGVPSRGGPPSLPGRGSDDHSGTSAPSLPSRMSVGPGMIQPPVPSRDSAPSIPAPSSGGPPSLPGRDSNRMSVAPGTIQPPPRSDSSGPPSLPGRDINRMSVPPGAIQPPPRSDSSGPPSISGPSAPPRENRMSMGPGMLSSPSGGPPSLPGRDGPSQPPRPAPRSSPQPPARDAAPPSLPGRDPSRMSMPPGAISSLGGVAAGGAPPPMPNRDRPPVIPPSSGGPSSPSLPGRQHSASAAPAPVPRGPPAGETMPFPTSIITEEEQKKYSLIFKRENPENTGQISGQKAFVMFTRSGLPQTDLAMIWELADQNKDGNLSREEFIIAMWVINAKLMGKMTVIPESVPAELVIANLPKQPVPSPAGPPQQPSRDNRLSMGPMAGGPAPIPPRGPAGGPSLPPPRGPNQPQFAVNSNDTTYGNQYGGNNNGFNAQGAFDDASAQARSHAQHQAGKAAAGAAQDPKNQQAMGNYIASRSDNKMVGAVAQNKWVQQKAGGYAAEKAQDEEFQQKMGDAAIKGAKEGGKAGSNAARSNSHKWGF